MPAGNQNAPDDIIEKLDAVTDLSRKSFEKFDSLVAENIALKAQITATATANTELTTKLADNSQTLAKTAETLTEVKAQVDYFQKSLDRPQFGSDKDVADFDHKSTEEILIAKHVMAGGDPGSFRVETADRISSKAIHTAMNKLMRAETRSYYDEMMKSLTDIEKKSVAISTIGQGFMIPQMLDMIKDCNILCASIVDLYDTVQVNKPTFKYPVISNYGNLGAYGKADDCAASFGTDSSVTFDGNEVKDWRGAWCMHEDVIKYAAFDFFRIMVQSMERSRLVTENQAFIMGDGLKEPTGWAKADKFPKFKTAAVGAFEPQDFRLFLLKGPTEFGVTIPVMHPYVFAYLASKIDADGRFIFGDGDITYNPNSIVDRLRVTKCLPDATANNSLDGSPEKPFASGAFLATNADWKLAYKRWVLEAMTVRPNFVVGPYCQQWTFRERSGGSLFCVNAGHTLTVA